MSIQLSDEYVEVMEQVIYLCSLIPDPHNVRFAPIIPESYKGKYIIRPDGIVDTKNFHRLRTYNKRKKNGSQSEED